MWTPLGRGNEDSFDEIDPQKSFIEISGLESSGECARQQSEKDLIQHLESAGIHCMRQASGERRCVLGYRASEVREHYNYDEPNRHNKLLVTLIGSQAIALTRYYYHLVDTLECDNEAEARWFAPGKVGEYLRNAGGLFNRIDNNSAQLVIELKKECHTNSNLLSFFFPSNVNVTTWIAEYAIDPFFTMNTCYALNQ